MSSNQTLLNAIHELNASFETAFPSSDSARIHPFAPNPPDGSALTQILDLSSLLTTVLSTHVPTANQKLVSLQREHATHLDTILQAGKDSRSRLDALGARIRPHLYGEDIPVSRDLLPEWVISRIEAHARDAGLDVYKDPDPEVENAIAIALSGKVLVVDLELRTFADNKIDLISHKLSYARPADAPALSVLSSEKLLDDLLFNCIKDFVREAYEEEPDCVKAAKAIGDFENSLKYLVMLDGLAGAEGDSGVRWFRDLQTLGELMRDTFTQEAEAVSRSSDLPQALLDVLLTRGHAIPLPFITSPTFSFLIHVSPRGYLSLLKSYSSLRGETDLLDIPLSSLRSFLSRNISPSLFTAATLKLIPTPSISIPPLLDPPSIPVHYLPPRFSLLETTPPAETLSFSLPQASSSPPQWILDFGEGIVMPRMSMRIISELVGMRQSDINSDLSASLTNSLGMGVSMSFILSWVDLLVGVPGQPSHGRYAYTHVSPSGLHPPLRITLTAPMEPGFILGKVPVRTLSEVYGVLEVVRDQCWLNEFMKGREWAQDQSGLGLSPEADVELELDLQSLLHGTRGPSTLPVQVTIPSPSSPPSLVLTFPLPFSNSPLCRATISHDVTSDRGIRISLEGLGVDPVIELLSDELRRGAEEVVRRGLGMGVAGWIWAKIKAMRGEDQSLLSSM